MNDYDEEDDNVAIKNYIGGIGAIEDDEEEDEEDDKVDGMTSDDGNMAMQEEELDDQDDELEMDKEDAEIRPTGSVLLVADTEKDFSNLEVQVYDDENDVLYVHHEISSPAFPLCMAWMDCAPVPLDPRTGPMDGSFVVVGTFKPRIEIWNLTVIDVLEPSVTRGSEQDDKLLDVAMPKMSKRRKNCKTVLQPGSHRDSVMALDWNNSHRNKLASGWLRRLDG